MAITHVNVVPMDRDVIIPDQTVVIEGGRIRSIAGTSASAAPAASRVIDAAGQYLMPGLADMHVHWWDLDEYRLYLANGVTTVRNMWGAPLHLALQQQIRSGTLPGPHLVTTSPIVDGPGRNGRTIWSTSAMVAHPEEAEPLVRAWAERGYSQVKVYSWLSADAHAALCDAARRHGLVVTGHCPDSITYEQAIANGHTCFEHLTGIRHGHFRAGVQMPDPTDRANRVALAKLAVEQLDLDSIRRLAQLMAAKQVWNCPTTVVWQQGTQRPTLAKSDPDLRFMSLATRAGWDPTQDFRFREQAFTDDYYDTMARLSELYIRIVGILHQEGAPLLLGTDTPNPYVIPGFSIHRELDNLRRAGLSTYEALRCGTSEAARFLGEPAEWGTVEVGKRADLLLLSRNPLDDLAAVKDLSQVFVNGYAFPRSALNAALEQRAAAAQRPPSFDTALDPPTAGISVLRTGTLRDVVAGAPVAEITFRHGRTSSGTVLVEERTATAHGPAAQQVRTTALELRPDGSILRGTQHLRSPHGDEVTQIDAAADGGTIIRVQAIDGVPSETAIEGSLIATERLSVTALSLAVRATVDERPRRGLTMERGEPKSVSVVVKVEQSPTDQAPASWRVDIDRVSELTEQTYRLDRDGGVTSVEETSPRGERRIAPIEAGPDR